MLVAILLSIFTVLLSWWFVHLYKINRYLEKYPGPYPLPIIGNAHQFKSVTDLIPQFMELIEKYGSIVKIMLGWTPRLIINDHKFLEFLLGNPSLIDKSREYVFLQPWLGDGLLTSTGEKWKRHRKLITPTFHFEILKQFVNVFGSQSSILINRLRKEAGGKSFDIYPYITMCTLDIICEAAMGTTVNAQNSSDSEYVRCVKEMCRIVMERSFSPVKMWSFLYVFTSDYRLEKHCLKVLHGFTESVIETKKAQLESNVPNQLSNEDHGIKYRLAFLDLLLQCKIEGQPLSDQSIREEVDTFMFEGHDTTASGISFALYCLARNPKIQEKVVAELKEIFSDDNTKSATYKDLQEMKYLELVIKESMRLYPPVPIFARNLVEDVHYDDVLLPKGLQISIFPYGLHRQENVFPDPEKFDPDRFLPENVSGRSPYAYLPFSAGPRNCIGQRFAMLEVKSTVSKVLRNFELLPEPQHEPLLSSVAILKSENGLFVRLKERTL